MIRLLRRFTDWVLYTSLFAAMCSVGLSLATEKLVIGYLPTKPTMLHVFIFCSTLFVYNTHYLVKRSSAEVSDRFQWSQHYKAWHYLFLTIGVLGCGISIFFLSFKILLACVVLGVLSFAYSLPLLPFKDKRRLKDFGWIKIFVLTGVWAIVTSVLPIIYWDALLSDYIYEILIRFVFMFTLCVAFDIRDMQTDMDNGIATLPNVIGVKNSYIVMSVAMILFIIMSFIQYLRHPSIERLIAEILVAGITKLAIDYAKKHPSDRNYLAFVDGMMLLYGLLVILL